MGAKKIGITIRGNLKGIHLLLIKKNSGFLVILGD